MSYLDTPEHDHEYYSRLGRQMQARETWSFFSELRTQIKNSFAGQSGAKSGDVSVGQK